MSLNLAKTFMIQTVQLMANFTVSKGLLIHRNDFASKTWRSYRWNNKLNSYWNN